MLLCIQCLRLQKTPQLTGEIPVPLRETLSLVQGGINLNHEVAELGVSMLCELLWESIWILYLFFFLNWIGSFVPWGKEVPGKSCHKRFLCSSLTRLKWRLFTMKMLCLWEKFHLLNPSVSSMFWCARSLRSALKGVRKGECLQWLWHNFLELGVKEAKRKVTVLGIE